MKRFIVKAEFYVTVENLEEAQILVEGMETEHEIEWDIKEDKEELCQMKKSG